MGLTLIQKKASGEKEFLLVFTIQKLRAALEALSQTIEGPGHLLSPVYGIAAPGPMALPSSEDANWQTVDVGRSWGHKQETSWLMTRLQVPASMQELPLVLQLHWHTCGDDPLLLRMEATVFLDGRAIGAFDWRHPALVLPEQVDDGQSHTLLLQVYTSEPLLFEGLTLHTRRLVNWRLYHLMQTLLEAALALPEGDLARIALLERLDTAYTMLDLREGWRGKRFMDSAQAAGDYLKAHLADGLASGNRPRITVSGHGHLDVAWLWPYWRSHQKIAHTIANVLSLLERYPAFYYSQSQPQLLQWLKEDVPELYARVKQRVAEGRFRAGRGDVG